MAYLATLARGHVGGEGERRQRLAGLLDGDGQVSDAGGDLDAASVHEVVDPLLDGSEIWSGQVVDEDVGASLGLGKGPFGPLETSFDVPIFQLDEDDIV